MHKRLLTMFMVALTGIVFLGVGSLMAEEGSEQEQPDAVTIDTEGYRRKLFKPIEFTHLEHADDYALDCVDCHHEYKEGENVWEEGDLVQQCVVCHNPKQKLGENAHRLPIAYHFNCKGCHKEVEEGPVECKECHEKK